MQASSPLRSVLLRDLVALIDSYEKFQNGREGTKYSNWLLSLADFGNFVIRIEVDVQLHQQLVSQLFNNLCINVGTSVAEFRCAICTRASFWMSMNGKLRQLLRK